MRYCLALDLVDNQQLIQEYERHHRDVWPGRPGSHPQSRVLGMEIFRLERDSRWSWRQTARFSAQARWSEPQLRMTS